MTVQRQLCGRYSCVSGILVMCLGQQLIAEGCSKGQREIPVQLSHSSVSLLLLSQGGLTS